MNIIVCLTPKRQFGKLINNDYVLVKDINEATKFTEDYKDDLTYVLEKFREKYVASTFICCKIHNVVFDEPIDDILDKHIDSSKIAEVLY